MAQKELNFTINNSFDIEKLNETLTKIIKKTPEYTETILNLNDRKKDSMIEQYEENFYDYMKEVFIDEVTLYDEDYFINEWKKDKCETFPSINDLETVIETDKYCKEERESINRVRYFKRTDKGFKLILDSDSKDNSEETKAIISFLKERVKTTKNGHFSEDNFEYLIDSKIEELSQISPIKNEKKITKINEM